MSSADAEQAFAAGIRNGATLPATPANWDLYVLDTVAQGAVRGLPYIYDPTLTTPAWRGLKTRFETGVTNLTPVVNTADETLLLATPIPAGLLGTINAVRVSARMIYTNNSGASTSFTFRLKYGAETIATIDFTGITSNALPRALVFEGMINAMGSPTAQAATTEGQMGAPRTQDGLQDGNPFSTQVSAHSAIAEDSNVERSMQFTVQHGTADALISVTPQAIYLFETRG